VLATLSDAQLDDAGIDRAVARGTRPVVVVNARLAMYKASLR
jgi:hypothetical protein